MKGSVREEIMVLTGRATEKKFTGNMQIFLLIKAMPIMLLILLNNLKT